MRNALEITDFINSIVGNDGETIWATADISYSDFNKSFSRAIIIARKFNEFITSNNYEEQKFRNVMTTMTESTNQKIELLKESFDQNNIKNYIPPEPQTDEVSLVAEFSFKYAAVKAGLGWIGKSGVLVTKEFGPRVRLGAILIDFPLKCGDPIEKSSCGNCHARVDACPWGFIKGNQWNIDSKRHELLDYQSCNKKRSEYIEFHGRKHACGYCMFACPYGMENK